MIISKSGRNTAEAFWKAEPRLKTIFQKAFPALVNFPVYSIAGSVFHLPNDAFEMDDGDKWWDFLTFSHHVIWEKVNIPKAIPRGTEAVDFSAESEF